jgi:hypothetical protein
MKDKRSLKEIEEDEMWAEILASPEYQSQQNKQFEKQNKFRFQALDDLVKKGKTPSVEHISEDAAQRLGIPWKDKEYNYRINPDYDTHYITDKNNKTLGHFALDSDDVTRSVYINPEVRGQGLGYKAHEALASKIPIQMDDANEPEIYKIWDKLKDKYGNKIKEIGTTSEGKPRLGFIEKLESIGGGRFKSIPLIGPAIGAGIAAMSGEANAASAMPILGEADSLGPEKGSEDYAIENPQASPELRRKALESLLRK